MDEQAVRRLWQGYALVVAEVSGPRKRFHEDYDRLFMDSGDFGPYLAREGLVSS